MTICLKSLHVMWGGGGWYWLTSSNLSKTFFIVVTEQIYWSFSTKCTLINESITAKHFWQTVIYVTITSSYFKKVTWLERCTCQLMVAYKRCFCNQHFFWSWQLLIPLWASLASVCIIVMRINTDTLHG